MRLGTWPTLRHRVTRGRGGVRRRLLGGVRGALPLQGPQEVKPASWVVAEELPVAAGGVLLGEHYPDSIEMPDFRLVEIV